MFSTSSQKLSIDKLSKDSTLEFVPSDTGDAKELFGGSWLILQGQFLVLREEEIRREILSYMYSHTAFTIEWSSLINDCNKSQTEVSARLPLVSV